jgi:GntR family transcriptional regulator, phosphonate transport system regulatory protein
MMAIWQNIRDTLVEEIEQGILAAGGRLPGDNELAVRFGVNRHTVRRALSRLQAEGLVRSERGRGTFVVEDAIAYRFGAQTRFEENLLENQRIPSRRLVSSVEFAAPEHLARQLRIKAGAPILLATLLGEADGVPVHLYKVHFPLQRLPAIGDAIKALPVARSARVSLGDLLGKAGIKNFRRRTARIRCRLPDLEEARHLKMSAHDPILESDILTVSDRGVPLFFGVTCYCGSRIEFVLDY